MTQEDKQLLLKDLCARLPYKTKILITVDTVEGRMEIDADLTTSTIDYFMSWTVQPYLRPMSSMTEKEKDYYDSMFIEVEGDYFAMFPTTVIDYLNSHHFDYRGLIEKGLALEAPKDMYKEE